MQRDEGARLTEMENGVMKERENEALTAERLERELAEAEEKLKKAEALIAAVAKELGERPPEKGTQKERV